MILTQLTGGLGNQMFQYACGLAVSLKLGVPLGFYFYSAKGNTKRNFELQAFNISQNYLLQDQKAFLNIQIAAQQCFHFLTKRQLSFLPRIFKEYGFTYTTEISSVKDNSLLIGYWQSEKYFTKIKSQIHNEFSLKEPLDSKNQKMLVLIQKTNSVGIHVRRGDYVSSKVAAEFHGALSLEYYQQALSQIESSVQKPTYFIFSDDLKWVQENLHFNGKKYFVDGNTGKDAYKDLHLLSNCKHNIIANSSFSWWGAWLNSDRKKIIIAPKQWTKNQSVSTIDLIPPSWIQI